MIYSLATPTAVVCDLLLPCLLTGLTAFFVYQLAALTVFLACLTEGRLANPECLAILLKPLVLCAASFVAALFPESLRAKSRLLWAVAALAVCGLTLAVQAIGPFGPVYMGARIAPMGPFLIVPFAACLVKRPAGTAKTLAFMALAFLFGAGALVLGPTQPVTQPNRLGLVAMRPHQTLTVDFSKYTNKDHYPVCRFESNSLGYRDREPSFAPKRGLRRVLLVGDSFVWGDGIPANEETLGALLRDELDRRAPGRYEVMSAAHVALGLYGYSRIIESLAPRYAPDVILVQHAMLSLHTLSDPQFLLDRLPTDRHLRQAVMSVGAIQYMNETVTVLASSIRPSFADEVMGLASRLQGIARHAADDGSKVFFFSYDRTPGSAAPLPAPLSRLVLPAAWSYPGFSTDLWYAKDAHPKTKLNRLVASRLADAVISSTSVPTDRRRPR